MLSALEDQHDARDLAFELRGVHFKYRAWFGLKSHAVLSGVDLSLARGRTLGLAGPNGSGKTTLLRLLVGIDAPQTGELSVLGGDPDLTSVRRRIGFLPESAPFPPHESARKVLEVLGSLQGMTRGELGRRADEMLERVGLAAHARTHLQRYSRGMLRRFGLAQAWIARPELLLLDEPTAGLDAEGFEVLDGILAEARERKAAVVIASHLISDLRERCDELAVLLDGRVAVHGDPRRLLEGRGLLELYREHRARPAAPRGASARSSAAS